ncbi:MAG: Trm112 family protein [Thaumarchaeota archaeon]|nr:Trm112 family protein [Nitrososphaerota archaeon]
MKYRLMDLLACPVCKHFPLTLYVFNTRETEAPPNPKKCELYCGYHSAWIEEIGEEPRCEECWRKEIVNGLLYCEKCGRWYPIEDEIPRMLPDDLRDRNKDVAFLARWKARIPVKILREGKPFNLQE